MLKKTNRCFVIRLRSVPETTLYLYFKSPTNEPSGEENEKYHRFKWWRLSKNFKIEYYRHYPEGNNPRFKSKPKIYPKLRLVKDDEE